MWRASHGQIGRVFCAVILWLLLLLARSSTAADDNPAGSWSDVEKLLDNQVRRAKESIGYLR
jgi:hypothetical protein